MHVMKKLHDNDKKNENNSKQKTVVLSKQNYDKLKDLGFTGDSFNTVMGRLLERLEEDED